MAITITKNGYGQVEPNHLSAMRTHQIYAQLPAASTIAQLENGQFAIYDYANGEVRFPKASGEDQEPMLVLNEVKLYGEKVGESYKDFVMKPGQFTDGKMYPRLYKTNVGDIMTLNTFAAATAIKVTDKLVVDTTGMLKVDNAATTGMIWKVVEETTMPDVTELAVKIQRIQ